MSTEEVEWVECYCCRLTEECTAGYIGGVRERYGGRWICWLCAEAVKEEMTRCGLEEALRNHVSFCSSFHVSPAQTNDRLIAAFRRLLRRRSLKAVETN